VINKRFYPVFFLVLSVMSAQVIGQGSLTLDIIDEIRNSGELDSAEQVIMNALTNRPLSDLIINRDFLTKHTDYFSHTIETKGVTDQERSGRCWLFAGLNVLRPKVIKKLKLSDFEFSQSYLFFWDKMEKANTFLEHIIGMADRDIYDRELEIILKRPVSDGGYWSYVVNLIDKYGVVPKDVMPEAYHTRNSWVMTSLLALQLRKNAVELKEKAANGLNIPELRKRKVDMLKVIYKMLILNMGNPPAEFAWRYKSSKGEISKSKTYTPVEFYHDVVDVDIKEYVALMNYPGKEYNRLYRLENARNIWERDDPLYANLSIEKMKELTLASVLDDEPVWFACDIMQDKDSEHGILSMEILDYRGLYSMDFDMSKEERIRYWESSGNHAMVFVGVDLQNGRPDKWLAEDSHGKDGGHNGHWTVYDDWFNDFLYVVVISKKYLPAEIKDIFEQKPIPLPPWDPMVLILRN
jgi:bleomycin hydrolase